MRCFQETFEVANYDKIINNKTRRKEKKRRKQIALSCFGGRAGFHNKSLSFSEA
jgi:hypothetical protein